MWDRTDLVSFLVGSSVAVSIVTTLYIGIAYSLQRAKNGGSQVSFSNIARGVPVEWLTLISSLAYGLVSLIIKKAIIDRRGEVSRYWVLLIGALTGLAFSLVGRFAMDLPRLLFGMGARSEWKVHVAAPILYAIVFQFYVYPVLMWALGEW